jgi:hypothetical protein
MDHEHRLVSRLFSCAAVRVGNVSLLALRLEASPKEVLRYMQGESIPPEDVLLSAVEIILDDRSTSRSDFHSPTSANL